MRDDRVMDGSKPERCDECGFDASKWRVRDAIAVFDTLGWWWRLAIDGIDPSALNRRPSPEVWSVLEYGVHSSLVTAVWRFGLELIAESNGVTLPPVPGGGASGAGEPATVDPGAVLTDLEREGVALARFARACPPDRWTNTGYLDETTIQAEAGLFHAVHDATHHQMDVGRGLAAIGAGAPRATGSIAQINVSGGGVPKRPVAEAVVTRDGLDGDVQADRKHHGRPFQALCLWSTEVIAELAAAGHPIEAGAAGENLTLSGIDWRTLRPGTRIRVGTAVAEVSYPATPCAKQTRWFSDGDFDRIDYERNPQWVRWYAWVREPGVVRAGDEVRLSEPA
jgi:MOSC domain-containing protein YiiM